MSVCVYPLPKDQQTRLGARTALAALAPFPSPRLWSAPWNLNRQPLTWARTTYYGWRPDLELPPGMPEEMRAEILGGQAAARGGPAPTFPESLSYSWNIDLSLAAAAGNAHATSTPAIPWPFSITGFFFTPATTGAAGHEYVLQLFATDEPYTEIPANSPETRLIPNFSPGFNEERSFGLGFSNPGAASPTQGNAIAAAIVGTTVPLGGKRLTIAMFDLGAPEQIMSGIITVQRWSGAPAFSSAELRATTIRVSVPRPAAPAPAPAAAPVVVTALPGPPQLYYASEYYLVPFATGFTLEEWRRRGYTQPVQPPGGAPILHIRQVETADQAYQLANQFDAAGRHAQAAIYRDMYNRMIRGLALTPEQRALLTSPGVYTPRVTAIYASPTIGAPLALVRPIG